MELNLVSPNGKKTVEANDAIFNCDYNEGLIHQVIVAQMAGLRSGNSAQKTRAEVRGGGIKPWRQKGTGRARAGTIRSPLWRKGGIIFAAKPRDYSQKVNKKMYRKAMCSILSELNRNARLFICESFDCEEPRTRVLKAKLQKMSEQISDLNPENLLIVCQDVSENLYLASRNLPHVQVIDVPELDPVSLVRYDKVLLMADALDTLVTRLGGV